MKSKNINTSKNIAFLISLLLILVTSISVFSQGTAINTTGTAADQSAGLDIQFPNKGLLIPRMTTNERNLITNPAEGLQIINITTKCIEVYFNPIWQNIFCGCTPLSPPTESTHTPSEFQIIWNWNHITGANGYKYNTINDYNTSFDNSLNTSYTQTGLNPNTLYNLYVWVYNDCGISNVKTLSASTLNFICGFSNINDIDGNTYNTVLIGSQCWLKENLKTSKYRNGIDIPNLSDDLQWETDLGGAYCCFNNNCITNGNTYGFLYNWHAVNSINGLCPSGWHIPSNAEWCIMENTVEAGTDPTCNTIGWRGTNTGNLLKEVGIAHWSSPNSGASNSSGFTALPGGYRSDNSHYWFLNDNGRFWSSTPTGNSAWSRTLSYADNNIYRNTNLKGAGNSIRCIKD